MILKGFFGWRTTKTDSWSEDGCYHDEGFSSPPDSQVYQSGKTNPTIISSHITFQVAVYQPSWEHQRKVVHQGTSSLRWFCMYTVSKPVRVAEHLLFINVYFIYQWVTSSRAFQSQMSVCVWQRFPFRHISAGGVMRAILQISSLVIFSSIRVENVVFLYHGRSIKTQHWRFSFCAYFCACWVNSCGVCNALWEGQSLHCAFLKSCRCLLICFPLK